MKQTQNLKINKHTQTKEHKGFMWFAFWPTSTSNNEEIPLIKIWRYTSWYINILTHTKSPIHQIALSQIQGIGKKLAFALFKKTIQHFTIFPKLIREMPLF